MSNIRCYCKISCPNYHFKFLKKVQSTYHRVWGSIACCTFYFDGRCIPWQQRWRAKPYKNVHLNEEVIPVSHHLSSGTFQRQRKLSLKGLHTALENISGPILSAAILRFPVYCQGKTCTQHQIVIFFSRKIHHRRDKSGLDTKVHFDAVSSILCNHLAYKMWSMEIREARLIWVKYIVC